MPEAQGWRFRCKDTNCRQEKPFPQEWLTELSRGWPFRCSKCGLLQVAKLNLPRALVLGEIDPETC
jgi:hypothetical protein